MSYNAFTDTYKISKTAYEALKKIKNNSSIEESSKLSDNAISKKKYNTVFNEFDNDKFNQKIALEMYVYNNLLDGINESEKEYVTDLISNMLNDVKSVYEFINIEPKLSGFKNMTPSNSKKELINEAQNIIDNHFKIEFYNLNKNERERKYKDIVVNMTYDIVESDHVSIDDALEHAHKSVIIESLIHNLNFPYIIRHKISEVLEDEMYNDFFDVDELRKSVERFEEKNKQLSRIIVAQKYSQSNK